MQLLSYGTALPYVWTTWSRHIRPRVVTMSSQTNRQKARRDALLVFITSVTLGGCASHGAPSFVLFGAFFPAWMLCALIGIFGAIAARGLFVALGLNSVLPYQLFVCSSVGLVVAAMAWLIWFGQ